MENQSTISEESILGLEYVIKNLIAEEKDIILYLPIHSIDGVECRVNLESDKDPRHEVIRLRMNTGNCFLLKNEDYENYQYYSNYWTIGQKEPRQIAVEILNLFDKLHYNRITNKFTLDPIVDWSKIIFTKNVILKQATCCVCFEASTPNIQCKHCVCIPCMDKIDKSQLVSDDEEDTELLCPLCRQEIVLDHYY
jgi:hypothetical protein